MLTDIVGFSERPTWDQQCCVDHLVDGLWKLDLMRGRRQDGSYYLNSTGDGFLLALPSQGPMDLPLGICDAVRELVGHCTGGSGTCGSFEIRVGIHLGRLLVEDQVQDGGFAVGTGLNWAARIGGLAGPSQVLVSEEFALHLLDHLGDVVFDLNLHPSHGDDPLEVGVKHGHPARLRILRDGSGVALNATTPPKLLLLQQVDDHLQRALRVVGATVEAVLHEVLADGSPEPLEPRHTL